jgi:methanogenic corrinoid protein MtbC1
LEKGISIGQVGDYLHHLETDAETEQRPDPWAAYERRMVNAIVRFDVGMLDSTYNDALSLYPVEMVTQRLILPLLKTLGERWASAEGSVAEEHFFGAYLRNKLGARFHHQTHRTQGPKIIAACMPGEFHEIGLMLFCLSAMNHDYRIIYLGADTPLREIIEPVGRTQAQAVLLSSSVHPLPSVLEEDLPQLVQAVSVPVFIGGDTAIGFRDAIVNAGAHPVGKDIQAAIKRMDELLDQAGQD